MSAFKWGVGGVIGSAINTVANAAKKNKNNSMSGGGNSKPASGGGGGSSSSSGGSSGGNSGNTASSGWVDPYPHMDYGTAIQDFMGNGYTDVNEFKDLMDNRYNKAANTPGLEQYKDDQLQATARQYYNYILGEQRKQEEAYNYDSEYDRADDARDAAIQSGVSSLQQQIPGINQNYDELARQAYIQKMMAQKALPGQLDAAGISGQGAAESTLAQQNNAYLQTLSGSEQARQNALQANQYAQENVKNTANLQYAQDATNIAMQQQQAAQARLQMQRQAQQDAIANVMSAGSLTGYYGGEPTLGMLEYQMNQGTTNLQNQGLALDNDQKRLYNNYYTRYVNWFKQNGMSDLDADLQAKLLANELTRKNINSMY